MQNTYPYYSPPMQNQFTGLKGRPVSSFDEARAASVDFDGSITYFPDLANNKIYTKQINMNGTATIKVYEYKETPQEQPYVTREEFNEAITKIQQLLQKPAETKIPKF